MGSISIQDNEVVTTAAPALDVSGGHSSIDSSSNPVAATLGSGTVVGQHKVITMSEASNPSTVVVAAHAEKNNLEGTFDAVGESWVVVWLGTKWDTVGTPTCTFVNNRVVTANSNSGAASKINARWNNVSVIGVTADADDWIVLPPLADVENGHTITICNNAGSNFELRTPAASNEKINTVDSDGDQEYLMTDTEVVLLVKVSDTDGWVAVDLPNDGGTGTKHAPN